MKLDTDLIQGKFIKRYKRFFVDAELEDGTVVTAHCPNTGSMLGLMEEGVPVYLSPAKDPNRKLKFTLEMIKAPNSWVGINTGRPNKIVHEALVAGKVKELKDFESIKPEQKYGTNSRIDLLVQQSNGTPCYVEVKNVTLAEGDTALFPDAVTTRGAKHLNELAEEAKKGNRALMFYLVQRSDCTSFNIAEQIDPTYAETLKAAMAVGVEAVAYQCNLSDKEIVLDKPLPITF